MQLPETKSSHKGISPLVAVVLLVSITMAASVVIAYWANLFVREETEKFEEFTEEEKQCRLANIRFLESLEYSGGSAGTFTAIVENNGRVSISGFKFQFIYTDNTTGNVTISDDTLAPGNFLIVNEVVQTGKEPRYARLATGCRDVFLEWP